MVYTGDKLNKISFPLGGIGTGSIGLAGNGGFVDWEIYNRPNKGSVNNYTCFAIKAEYPDGKSITKILQGDLNNDLSGQYCNGVFYGFGFGPVSGTMCAFPHFENVVFDGKFPLAKLTFSDNDFPAEVILTAFNPFIPLDADNSSIPAAFFDIEINNKEKDIKYTVVFSVNNPFDSTVNEKIASDKCTAVMMKSAGKNQDEKEYGDMTVAVDRPGGIVQEYWYRGQWQDKVTTFWYDLTNGCLDNRHYDTPHESDVCSVGCHVVADEKPEHIRFVLSWNIPNNYNYWDRCLDEKGNDILWKNYYATKFADSSLSAFYALDNFDELLSKTKLFCNSLHNSSLDPAVIDAVSSTLSVLKSPTVLRLQDGTFYGWEGVHEHEGSCEGTCTHVWSYAYALCFLFPQLERSIRETEFNYDTDETGSMCFRTKLPLGREGDRFRPCVDGQMASVFKTYREWKISGDDDWLKANWDSVKKVLEFAWSDKNFDQWDRDRDGVLEGRQHHTLDMEMFGPSSWLEGMYLAALKSAAEMAEYLGETKAQKEYTDLFNNGYEWTKNNLFNGEYFIQKIDLKRKDYTEHFNCDNYWNDEKKQIKYQIGEGSEIDQMLAQWHSNICGIGDIYDKEQRRTALKSMFKNNFKHSLRDFANAWRIFALNDERGSVMCDYPEGITKPVIPIPYCEECMTGFEYSFAGLLISEGFINEGLEVVRAIRDRYDGQKRNPWNEIECGSNYARAMASFALIPIFSGFIFDLPKNHIGFHPVLNGDFRCLWSLGTGWGDYIKDESSQKILINGGYLKLSSVKLKNADKITCVIVDGKDIAFGKTEDKIIFDLIKIEKEIVFR